VIHTARRTLLLIVVAMAAAACGGDEAAPTTTAAAITTMGEVATGSCSVLFGSPTQSTGLGSDVCRPERICDGLEPFTAPSYDAAAIAGLRSRTLLNPPPLFPADPYQDPALVPDAGGVCGVLPADDGYRLETFSDRGAVEAAGGTITHTGACGACSSLQDLAVYLEQPDLGEAVRQCALLSLGGDMEPTVECITDLGFSEPCAQIWAFNSANTRASCLNPCLAALESPHHEPDGSLNPCLACDEEESGPVFKAVAGRSRRNSGIPSAICRPGESVSAVVHDRYP